MQQIMRVKCFRRASASAIVGQRLRKSHGRCPARPQGDVRCHLAERFAQLPAVAQLRRRPCARQAPAELDRRALGAEPRSVESEAHLHRLAGHMETSDLQWLIRKLRGGKCKVPCGGQRKADLVKAIIDVKEYMHRQGAAAAAAASFAEGPSISKGTCPSSFPPAPPRCPGGHRDGTGPAGHLG